MKTFKCNFGHGIIATMTSPDEFPGVNGEVSYQTTTWEGKLTRKEVKRFFPRYKQWVLESTQIMVDDWKKSVLYAFMLPNDELECWRISPGEPPEICEAPQPRIT